MNANPPSHQSRNQQRRALLALISIFVIGVVAAGSWFRINFVTYEKTGSYAVSTSPKGEFRVDARTLKKEGFWGGTREYFMFWISKF
jgi:hypothetical protein